ncbi:MAG TPA: PSD1 and planctomycete cytochrome C domain-containing protein [Cyclobacteriaceae bacterium]|nr:PSD1 and planctomycete cytochrome C domain-containing protein [Cyclobacteriaceae bacterium]
MISRFDSLGVVVLVLTIFCSSCREKGHDAEIPKVVSYNFHVRPILSDKCYACHGPDVNKREGSLRLDIADSAYKALKDDPTSFVIVPGDPNHSAVYQRIIAEDSSMLMPPVESNLKLTHHEIEIIKKWIKQGAKYEPHWAFTPPKRADLPEINDGDWPKNEIDYFVLEKIEAKGLAPNEEAGKERLLKRVSLDLTGLPPTIEMMDAFLADDSDNAYEKIVDELLMSPNYGEKMALHWLDVARYADSYGYQDDNIRGQWPWRDWVIHAFNENLPYDKFLTWQLAGDLLPNPTKEQILATAFNRNHKYTEEGGVIDEEYRIEYVTDKTNTFGRGVLGLTVECAKCHDHKYDPISQHDYYSLFSFFNNTYEKGYEGDITVSQMAKHPILYLKDEEIENILTFINREKRDTSTLMVSVMGERDTLRRTYILNRGVYDAPTTEVFPSTPSAVLPFGDDLPKNRLGLAQWATSRENPLTSRVFVNQLWQEFFGRGIVKTAGDFGMQGELPSHPELLDWLAVDFMDHGWDIKGLVKQYVMSATYRQSSVVSEKKLKRDPENIYLSHAPRNRLPAELVRDLVLASSGLLVKKIGGPSVKPYQPKGIWESSTSGRGALATYKQDHGESLYRRGMYTFIKLTAPPPSMIIFDASNRDQCEVRRLSTNTPLQALVMMNDPQVLEASRVLAAKLLKENTSEDEKLNEAFRLIVCRKPNEDELKVVQQYLHEQLSSLTKEKAAALLNVGEYPLPGNVDKIQLAAMMQAVSLLYNLEETIVKS